MPEQKKPARERYEIPVFYYPPSRENPLQPSAQERHWTFDPNSGGWFTDAPAVEYHCPTYDQSTIMLAKQSNPTPPTGWFGEQYYQPPNLFAENNSGYFQQRPEEETTTIEEKIRSLETSLARLKEMYASMRSQPQPPQPQPPTSQYSAQPQQLSNSLSSQIHSLQPTNFDEIDRLIEKIRRGHEENSGKSQQQQQQQQDLSSPANKSRYSTASAAEELKPYLQQLQQLVFALEKLERDLNQEMAARGYRT